MSSNTGIPILDLRGFNQDKAAFVQKTGDAYRQFGFCGIKNHSIPDKIIETALAASRQFFSLPDEIKLSYHLPEAGGARGYTGMGIEVAKNSSHPDLKEFWHTGREIESADPDDILLPNTWPVEIKNFKQAMYPLYQAMESLGNIILSAVALYLGLSETYFNDKVNRGDSVLRALHYPPLQNTNGFSVRAGAHEDINLLTLMAGSHESGLEIMTRDNTWIPVTMIKGVIIVNVGDMLQRLTNRVLRSTTHRVVNPGGAAVHTSRFSIPFFLHPNPDFLIKTLPECITENKPDCYPEPIRAHDYLQERLFDIGLINR